MVVFQAGEDGRWWRVLGSHELRREGDHYQGSERVTVGTPVSPQFFGRMASLAECPVVRPCAVDAAPEGYRWLDMGESIPDEVHWYSDTGLITTNQAEAMRMGDRGAQARFFHVSAGGSGSFPDGGGCVVKLPTASDYAILLAKYNKLLLQLRTALKPIG